jgi:RNA-directed DNA polymerase
LQEALKSKSYAPRPVKRVRIPKADGSKRPLGIPAIRDRVAQMALKLVIDADGSKYFDSILHARLMAVLAERIVDGALLHIIRMWLKAPVMGEDEDGTRRTIGGGKANTLGTPQGGVISPLLANLYASVGPAVGAAAPSAAA